MVDDHYRGVRHVYADFDDSRRYQDLDFATFEAQHHSFFFLTGQPPMQQADAEFRKYVPREVLVHAHRRSKIEFARFFDHRVNDIGLLASPYFFSYKLESVPTI